MSLKFYNTLSRQLEEFVPLDPPNVGLYTCGPTVYMYAHIGNLRTYIFEDILKRVLLTHNYKVNHVMNITDVGHLTSDADTGEDKLEKEAIKEKKNAWEIAAFYTTAFQKDLEELNIIPPNIWCKATEHINEQIELIQRLENKGFTYKTSDGIYFDTSKLADYGKLAGLNIEGLRAGIRVEMIAEKKNPTDFALWKFSPIGIKRQMEWDSPWGKGFPGWHIECAAMSMKYLGETFDIHCGGIDHIPVHHTNEIAEAEAATGKPFVKYWLHGEFLELKEGRMGKSEGNAILVSTLKEKGFDPLSYRYLILNTHYRKKIEFDWDSLAAAQMSLQNLKQTIANIQLMADLLTYYPTYRDLLKETKTDFGSNYEAIIRAFNEACDTDLNMPQALASLNIFLNKYQEKLDFENASEILNTIAKMDTILGLKLLPKVHELIPANLVSLLDSRKNKREEKDWAESDRLRNEIESLGFWVKDTPRGQIIEIKGTN
ncbi:MAG TPA: cysteine--tRNA ligase [Candidatus Paceibacterota bacterium]|nr:cysteine--tRNA ligase [Candidatus Paceibacterota bacterium]